MSELETVWGKFDEKCAKKLPLLAHLCDVAAVFECLALSPTVQRHFQHAVHLPLSPDLVERLSALALWHDFGKISPLFQLKDQIPKNDERKPYTVGHLRTGWNLFTSSKTPQALCDKILNSGCLGHSEEELETALMLILGHHGASLPESVIQETSNLRPCWTSTEKIAPDIALTELIDFTQSNFPIVKNNQFPIPDSAAFQHYFSGMLMLADWIGSDRSFFPYCGETDWSGLLRPPFDTTTVLDWSREQAKKVLSHLGWDISVLRPATVPDFKNQFGFSPNSIQSAVDKIELNNNGGLYILEAETGSGKTETALRLFTRLFQAGLIDGLYFANPLRFAATQLFERMNDFSKHLFGESRSHDSRLPVTLAVPGYLRVGESEGIRTDRYSVDWGEEINKPLGWFAENSKRFLAAPLASGTIDQALLAAMKVPHADMRAFALQRSLLVVDEVHSSDAYMSQLLCGLLKIYKAVGGHVLLMSATLGSESLTQFWDAWNGGGAKYALKRPSLEEAITRPYPSLVTDSQQKSPELPAAKRKQVYMRPMPLMTDIEGTTALVKSLFAERKPEDAPCVLVLRNSVRQARLTFDALKKALPPELLFSVNGIPTIHHSRYSPDERRFLDREVEKRFGKAPHMDTQQVLRNGCVLVSTQTVEQSLDVDFDLLITDLCPADVLLQRIGRLFRHKRPRPEGFTVPRCIVLTPADGYDWLLSREAAKWGFGTDRAYTPIAAAATLNQLQEDCVWDIPGQNRALVEACTHHEALATLVDFLGKEKWGKCYSKVRGVDMSHRSFARTVMMPWDFGLKDISINNDMAIETLKTRLGVMDVCVKCEEPAKSPLGTGFISSFSLPAWMLGDAYEDIKNMPKDENGAYTIAPKIESDVLSFDFCGKVFYYDVTGLMSQKEYEERYASD